jgi:hypothetical protein
MTSKDIYTLFTDALDVMNQALEKHRDSGFMKGLVAAADKFLDGHKAGVEIYDEDPGKPFDYFTIRYLNDKFEILSRGKSEHDTEWKVSRDYLQAIVDDPQKYIDHPSKLDLDWLKHRLPDAASSLLEKAS